MDLHSVVHLENKVIEFFLSSTSMDDNEMQGQDSPLKCLSIVMSNLCRVESWEDDPFQEGFTMVVVMEVDCNAEVDHSKVEEVLSILILVGYYTNAVPLERFHNDVHLLLD